MFVEIGNQSGRTTPAGATVLDPAPGYATTMNTYNATPERIEEVLEYLIRSAENVVRYQARFVFFQLPRERGPYANRELRAVAKP